MIRANGWDGKSPIRLLSCSTGKLPDEFAQNLADTLGVLVKAPNDLLWVWQDGRYLVAPRDAMDPKQPDFNKIGHFKKFMPRP
jgi:hypothetical protein